jgi:hypothetical protein
VEQSSSALGSRLARLEPVLAGARAAHVRRSSTMLLARVDAPRAAATAAPVSPYLRRHCGAKLGPC